MKKYILFKSNEEFLADFFIVFPRCINHKHIAEKFKNEIIGAGFVENGKVFGESTSLNKKSNPDDQILYISFMK